MCGDRFLTWSKFKEHLWCEHEPFRIQDQCEECGNTSKMWSWFALKKKELYWSNFYKWNVNKWFFSTKPFMKKCYWWAFKQSENKPNSTRRLCCSSSISVHFTLSRLRINSSYRFNSDLKLKFLSVCSGSLLLLVQRSQVDDKVLKCNISLEEHEKSQIIPSGLF